MNAEAVTAATHARRVLLVPAAPRKTGSGRETAIKRFRLARLSVEPRDATGPGRFDHLKRSYD